MSPGGRIFLGLVMSCCVAGAFGHNLSADNARFVQQLSGTAIGPYLYLGAKHMFTGYDHLLFLLGVIFYLYHPRDIIIYVSLFTVGHSITLLAGVILNWQFDSHLIDGIIGLSIAYKAFENMDGFRLVFDRQPNPKIAVFIFGLCHGLGLATRLQDYMNTSAGRTTNLISFNLGVELGQLFALAVILVVLLAWRQSSAFHRQAFTMNAALMSCGFILAGLQFMGLAWS